MYRRRYRRATAARIEHSTLAAALLLLTLLGLGLTACGSDEDSAVEPSPTLQPHPTSPTPSATADPNASEPTNSGPTTTEAPTPEEQTKAEVEAAFLAAHQAMISWFMAPEGSHPVDQHFVDPAASVVADIVSSLQEQRLRLDLPEGDSIPEIRRIDLMGEDQDEATVISCLVDRAVQVNVDTQEAQDDEVQTELLSTVLHREEADWLVSEIEYLERWPDDQGCDR